MKSAMQKIADKEVDAAGFIPYSYHVTDTVISTRQGEFLSVWRVDGRSHQAASLREHAMWLQDLNALLRGLPTANLGLYSHIVRRRVFEYPQASFDEAFPRQLDAKYRARFEAVNTMVNDLYLTVIYRPITDAATNVFALGDRASPAEIQRRQDEAIAKLDEINMTLSGSMVRYGGTLLAVEPRVKGEPTTADAAGAVMFSPALEVFSSIINGKRQPVPVCRDQISAHLSQARVLFAPHGEVGEMRGTDYSRFFALADVAEYPSATEAGQLNELLESDFEFVLTQSFACKEKSGAKAYMERHQKHLMDAKDAGRRQIAEITDALDALVSGEIVLGEHHASLMVLGDTPDEVRKNLAGAIGVMTEHGVIAKRCDMSLDAAFWAQLPANWRLRPRTGKITSLNFLSFSPFHNFMSGKPIGNPWGPATTVFETNSGTSLYFSFHSSAQDVDATDKRLLGNTIILGESGAGKTVLLAFLLTQATKHRPRIVAFDKDRGMELAIRAMGGRYLPLKSGEPSGFNPLQLELTPPNLMFLKSFLKLLIAGDGGEVSHLDDAEIDEALRALALLPKEVRRLKTLLQAMPRAREGGVSVAGRLKKWTDGQELGWLFDNPTDALNLDTHSIYGFDVTDFLDNPVTRGAVMSYLFYRTDKMIDGRPFIYVLDEFWKALQDKHFQVLILDSLKTIRKKNGIIVFATQEPGDALGSPIGKTIVAQCSTKILLPNKGADQQDYCDGLKLTTTEYGLVRGLGEQSRQFLIKQGERSAIAKLNLRGFDDELLVLSGTPDNAEKANEIIEELREIHGDAAEAPAMWLPVLVGRLAAERKL